MQLNGGPGLELRVERTGEYKRVLNALWELRMEFMRIQSRDPQDPRLDILRTEIAFLKRSLILMDYERDGMEPPRAFQRDIEDPDAKG